MKKAVVLSLVLVGLTASGCRTVIQGEAEKWDNGQLLGRSKLVVSANGDKASQIATEGLGVNVDDGEYGVILNSSAASQKSSGVDSILKAFTELAISAASLGVVNRTETPLQAGTSVEQVESIGASASIASSPLIGVVSDDGVGVWGRDACPRCQAYMRNHPEVEMIDIDANRSAFWAALRARGKISGKVQLPVEITSDGFIEKVK